MKRVLSGGVISAPQSRKSHEDPPGFIPYRPPFSAHIFYFLEEVQVGSEHRILLFEVGAALKRVLGKVIYSVKTDGVVHIDNIWVAEGIRNLGLGRVLLQQALSAAVDIGSKRVLLEAEEDTRRHNRLVSFYIREGFSQLGGDSFIKYIPHGDGCFRKVPMHLHLENIVTRPRFFSGDQILPVELVRKPGLCLGVQAGGGSLVAYREHERGLPGGYGERGEGSEGGEWCGEEGGGTRKETHHRVRATPPKPQVWLLNRHEDASDDDDDDVAAGAFAGAGAGGAGAGADGGKAPPCEGGANNPSSSSCHNNNNNNNNSGGSEFSLTLMNESLGVFLTALPNGCTCADRKVDSTWESLSVVALGTSCYALRTHHGQFLGFDLFSNELKGFARPSAWRLSGSRRLEWVGEGPGPYDACARGRATQGWDYVQSLVRRFDPFHASSRRQDEADGGWEEGGHLSDDDDGSPTRASPTSTTRTIRVGNSSSGQGGGFGSLARLSLHRAVERLLAFHDPLFPDSELSHGQFVLLCAEVARTRGLPDWVQLMLLVQGAADLVMWPELLAGSNRSQGNNNNDDDDVDGGGASCDDAATVATAAARWVPVFPECEAWLVGCALPSCLPHASVLNSLHPDEGAQQRPHSRSGGSSKAPSAPDPAGEGGRSSTFSSASFGVYARGCGVSSEAVQPVWTKFEYAFRFLRHNRCSAPWEGLSALRLAPLRCWHSRGAYAELGDHHRGGKEGEAAGGRGGEGRGLDAAVLPWAQILDECILEARDVAKRTHPDRAPRLGDLWEAHYAPVAAKYLPSHVLDW